MSTTRTSADLDPVSIRLEFLAGLMLLPPDAKETEQIAIAHHVGLDGAAVARIFKKTPAAANMALSRARNRKTQKRQPKKRK